LSVQEKSHFMSNLFLVRHGQASFLEPDYDRLSAKGETQARFLGEYWARKSVIFDLVYSGPRRRQKETARIVGEAYRAAGVPWPDPVIVPEFDEFQAEAVMSKALPQLVASDAQIRQLHAAFQDAQGTQERFKTFQRVFELVIGRWAHGELPVPGLEPWQDFCSRVQRGLGQLCDNGSRGRRVAVFSSGGPVGVAMQKALDLDTRATLKIAWMVANGAFSEFLFSPGRFTLHSFNAYPHLTDPNFLTYR
jgi:broad specificity phosphatase PhoE